MTDMFDQTILDDLTQDTFESIKSNASVFFTESFEALDPEAKRGLFSSAITKLSRVVHNTFILSKPKIIHINTNVITPHTADKVPFLNIAQIEVENIPELTIKWDAYANLFNNALDEVISVRAFVLIPFISYSKKLIADPHLSNSHVSRPPNIQNETFYKIRDEFIAALSGKEKNRYVKLGEVVRSYKELEVTIDLINRLYHLYIKDDRARVISLVDDLDRILSKWVPENTTAEFNKEFGSWIYNIAERVEFYAYYGHKLEQFATNLDRSVAILKKVI